MTETMGSDECAVLLRCTPQQAEELARNGDIPAVKLGRSWLYVRHDLIAYLAERAREEAKDRRSKRQPNVAPTLKPSRRREPPVLPTS